MRAPLGSLCAAVLAASFLPACGGGVDPNAADPSDKLTLPVPATLAGLVVSDEPKASAKIKKEAGKDSYMKDARVFSLREGKELRAVLQVIRLTADARPEDIEFRRKIADQIRGSSRKPEEIKGVLVYKGINNQQVIYVWFVDRFMQVLIVRETPQGANSIFDVAAVLAEAVTLKPALAA